MRFYTSRHRFYCGVDLHARTMHLCVLDHQGNVVGDKNLACRPEAFLRAVAPFRDGLVVGVECMFAWYWLADLCHEQHIDFVLGHALYWYWLADLCHEQHIDDFAVLGCVLRFFPGVDLAAVPLGYLAGSLGRLLWHVFGMSPGDRLEIGSRPPLGVGPPWA